MRLSRAVIVALVLAVSPVWAGVCEIVCASPARMSDATPHQQPSMPSHHAHHSTDAAAPATESAAKLAAAGDMCRRASPEFARVGLGSINGSRDRLFGIVAFAAPAAMATTAGRMMAAAASPPPLLPHHTPIPLRI